MGKLLGGFAMLFAVVFALLMLGLVPAIWDALFNGGSWGVVWLLALPAGAAFGIGTALDRGAKRAGWDPLGWKAIDQTPTRTRGQLPPGGRSVKQHFMTTAVEEMLVNDPSAKKLSSQEVIVMDSFLQTYVEADVAWRDLWIAADINRIDVPPFDRIPYWSPRGLHSRSVPTSSLAFWGAVDRQRMASDPNTARALLTLLSKDPNFFVARSAAESLRVADLGAPET